MPTRSTTHRDTPWGVTHRKVLERREATLSIPHALSNHLKAAGPLPHRLSTLKPQSIL